MPQLSLPDPQWASFDRLFAALVSEWRRLAGRSDLWAGIHTIHLSTALGWMDKVRYRKALERLARRKAMPEAVRRRAAGEVELMRRSFAPL